MRTDCEKSQISKTFTRCELNLIETRKVYYFSTDCAVLGSSCFASEAYHSRSVFLRMTVQTEIEAGPFRVGQDPC